MGIQGLLPLLKSIMVPVHLKDLEGCSVAVDTYSWLHKGALSCSAQLCKGFPTSRHIDYCMHRVNLLRHNGVKPILVFDGGFLPMKGDQENKRARSRKENLARAIEHEANGNSKAAYECYQKAVDISPSVAHELIQVLKRESVQYVVAPYEADAQMTFLAISNQVDAVITEDSDLIPFGCPRIIYKMDKFGQGVEFRHSMLHRNKELSFAGFTKQMLLEMCILSGCDYLPSLPGMGLKRAHALIKQFKSYDKVIKHLRYSTVAVPPLYEDSFKKAILTFQHQRVYDPAFEDLVHLSDIPDNIGDDLDFLGPCLPQHVAKGIAEGDIDPFTQMPFQGERACTSLELDALSQLKNTKNESERKKLDLPVQKNLLTKYFCFASLEAKRNFRAPRISPKPPSPTNNSTLTVDEDLVLNAAADKINCSPSSSLDTEIVSSVSPPPNLVEDDFTTEVPVSSESPKHCAVDKMTSSEHASLQQPGQVIHRPCQVLHKERNSKIVHNTIKGTENRRVITRSSYFHHKPILESDQGSQQGTENDFTNKTENTIPKDVSFRNYSFDGATLKRKNTHDDIVEMENVRSKVMRTNEPCPNNEIQKEEGKFGSDISHLGHYSDIAEQSMERFVSVISSFRYNPSGSRASGLRAPLKDVQSTNTNRSNVGADFSQFAYVPSNQKATSRRRR